MIRKTRVRIGIIVVIVGLMGFSDWSFATSGDEAKVFGSFLWTLDVCVSILSWIRILFAKIAGELLTNSWVYGSVIGMDALLWKYWNVMKNIANFGLGFYFVYVILKAVIGKEDITKKIKDIVLWILVAGIGIQASRFMTAVVVDLSTITLVAAGSFPSQVLSKNETFQKNFKSSLTDVITANKDDIDSGLFVDLFPKQSGANKFLSTSTVDLQNHISEKQLFDSLMPNADSISGPLYYMGVAILDTYRIPSVNSSNDYVEKSILNLIIQGGTTIVYSLEMIVLCVLAFMRIFYLWMFIVLSPIAILFWCIEESGDKDLGKISFVKSLMEQINMKSFFINVFKPTIMVIGIGLSMIFVIMVNGIIDKNGNKSHQPLKIGGVVIESKMDDNTSGDETYRTSITTDMGVSYEISHVGKGILDFILSIITVMLVYFIIDIAVKLGKGDDFVSKKVAGIHKGLGEVMTKTPLIPVTGYDKNGAKTQSYLSYNGLTSLPEMKLNFVRGKFTTKISQQEDDIMKMWGFVDNGNVLTEEHKTQIEQAGSGSPMEILKAKKEYIRSISNEKGRGMKLNSVGDQYWVQQFEKWLENSSGERFAGLENGETWRKMVEWWNNPDNKNNRSLAKMFEFVSGSLQAYATFFGLGTISSWNQLMEKDISSTNDTGSEGESEPTQSQPSNDGGTTGDAGGGASGEGDSGGGTSS